MQCPAVFLLFFPCLVFEYLLQGVYEKLFSGLMGLWLRVGIRYMCWKTLHVCCLDLALGLQISQALLLIIKLPIYFE